MGGLVQSGLKSVSSPDCVVVQIRKLGVSEHIDAEAECAEFGGRQILVLLGGDIIHLLAHGTTFFGQTAQ